MDELRQKAKDIIAKIIYINIATITKTNNPWNSPVFSAYDNDYNFYWRSDKNALHSKNIENNGKVFITIYATDVPWGKGEGVFIQAAAKELIDESEINDALYLLDKRAGKSIGKSDKFSNSYPRRVYKAVPQKFWMNVDGEVDGQFVDKKVEVQLI